MLQKKRMSGFAFLVIAAICIVFGFAGLAVASDPTPKFFNPAQERRIQELEIRIAALESALKPPQQMPAPIPAKEKPPVKIEPVTKEPVKLNTLGAPVELAPAGQHWLKVSETNWVLESDVVTAPVQAPAASPVFSTPVRSFIFNQTGVAVGTCKNGNCSAVSPVVPVNSTMFRR